MTASCSIFSVHLCARQMNKQPPLSTVGNTDDSMRLSRTAREQKLILHHTVTADNGPRRCEQRLACRVSFAAETHFLSRNGRLDVPASAPLHDPYSAHVDYLPRRRTDILALVHPVRASTESCRAAAGSRIKRTKGVLFICQQHTAAADACLCRRLCCLRLFPDPAACC